VDSATAHVLQYADELEETKGGEVGHNTTSTVAAHEGEMVDGIAPPYIHTVGRGWEHWKSGKGEDRIGRPSPCAAFLVSMFLLYSIAIHRVPCLSASLRTPLRWPVFQRPVSAPYR
jgi:hypothetical protein